MKDAALHVLITARSLLEQATILCSTNERHAATAGLIVLQDATELFFLGALLELGTDETEKIESFDFDQMMGCLRKSGVTVPKTGTLKAMNKLRVASKHYGQLIDPVTAQTHLNAAKHAIDAVLQCVSQISSSEIYLTELLPPGEVKDILTRASKDIESGNYQAALIEIRKAFFIEFESDYSIYRFREGPGGLGLLGLFLAGSKAPYYTKNKEWISQNVKTPYDYIQLDFDQFKLDALEWGINSQALQNIRRLTPQVMRLEDKADWLVRITVSTEVTKDAALYCLDTTVEAIRRKKIHADGKRFPTKRDEFDYPEAYVGQALYEFPRVDAKVIRQLEAEDVYSVSEILHGFDSRFIFYKISCTDKNKEIHLGYVMKLEIPLEGDTGTE